MQRIVLYNQNISMGKLPIVVLTKVTHSYVKKCVSTKYTK